MFARDRGLESQWSPIGECTCARTRHSIKTTITLVNGYQRLKPYAKFARMVEAHWDGIEAYCHDDNKVALGFVEGLNNQIRVIQRRAYGYRDEEYFRLKILTCMLPEL